MHSKGNHKQNEKTIHRTGENICKWWDRQGINLQNIQTAHAALYKKKKNQTTQSKNEYKTKLDIYPNNTYRWPRSIWKDGQHH